MEEALHDIPLYREFALLGTGMTRLPDESTPNSTKKPGTRDPEMRISPFACGQRARHHGGA
ncbi:hypothetical protein LMG24235_08535 [Paraburkholderia sabiae]|nr:hypothetical protein LMG24235_08535 [Paraburkholderia sabiae]